MYHRNRLIVVAMLTALALNATLAIAGYSQGVVNINSASAEQLALLPRVGEVVSQRIVDFRQQNCEFKSLEDMLLVRGIGEKSFDLIKPHITLKGETTLAEKVRVPRQADEDEEQ